jgi:hypothetical protein
MRHHFWWDLAAMLPLDLVPYALGRFDVAAWLRLTRLARVKTLPPLFGRLEKNVSIPFLLSRILKMSFWIMSIAHWTACLWFLIGFHENHTESWLAEDRLVGGSALTQYARSLYWSVTTLTTVGYGDVVPLTLGETFFSVLVLLVGQTIVAYMIGNISSVLQSNDTLDTEFRKKMASLSAYVDWRELPDHLRTRILQYFRYTWSANKGIDEERILEELPSSLRNEIAMFLNAKMVHRVPIFRDCSVDFIRKLVSRIKSRVVIPGDYVVREGDVGRNMYLIARGELEVQAGGARVAKLRAGSYVGEIALLTRAVHGVQRALCAHPRRL